MSGHLTCRIAEVEDEHPDTMKMHHPAVPLLSAVVALCITVSAQEQWISFGYLFVMKVPPLGNNQTEPHNSTGYI